MTMPWDQLAGESTKAYAAFCLYRDLGPRRSLDEASRRYHRSGRETQDRQAGPSRRASGTIRRWAQRWNWLARAKGWDQEAERVKQTQQHAASQEMAERHAKEAMLLQNKGIERLRQTRPEELKPREALVYVVEAIKIERLARGQPTEHLVEEHHFDDPKELTDEDLARIITIGRGRLLPPGSRGVTAETDGAQKPA